MKHRSKRITVAALAAGFLAINPLHAGMVDITTGSTTGYTMANGNTYVVSKSLTFSNSTAGGSGMSVADNATVVLYIPSGVTLTATGANGNGKTGGGAGIRVPQTATLIITGEGIVNATGGNAGNGGKGYSGGSGYVQVGGSPRDQCVYAYGGSGGNGGTGGGGAGAGIGGVGGTGSDGGAGGASASTGGFIVVPSNVSRSRNSGNNGSLGTAGTTMGTVVLLGTMTVSAKGGLAGTTGAAGGTGSFSGWYGVADNLGGSLKGYGATGGGGGGGGKGGASPQYGIGGGGAPGRSGGGGGSGGIYWGIENYMSGYTFSPGSTGATYSSSGQAGGNGTLSKAPTASVNVSRTMQSATTHIAAQYTISFNANGGSLSGGSTATATLGCALPDCVPAPTRSGYTFRGWRTETSGGTQYYNATGTKSLNAFTNTANVTLYAQWEKLPVLTVVSPFDLCSPAVGDHPIESSTTTNATCPQTYVEARTKFDCIGWIGTGDVPLSGNETNVTFTITHDSSLSWLWTTNVWIDCMITGNATSESAAGWYAINGESVVVPFEKQETKCVALMNGETNGVSVNLPSQTVTIPTDAPHELTVQILEVVNGGSFPLSWSDVSDEPVWSIAEDTSTSDGYCLKSGLVSAGETSSTILDVSGPGMVLFDWKISANRGDYARVYVDGVKKAEITRTTDWITASVLVEGNGRHTVTWSYERKATTEAGENAAYLDNVTWRPAVSFMVTSTEGIASPTGCSVLYWGDEVAASVATPEVGMNTRAVFTGWTGTGSVPVSGMETNVSFTITENSTLTWNWRTEYRIVLSTEGAVAFNTTEIWTEEDSSVIVPYRLTNSYAELELAGDVEGVTLNTSDRTLSIPADHPRSVILRTTRTISLTEALDGAGLAWTTDSGAEWMAQVAVTADGVDAAVSGPVDSSVNDASGLETTVTGPGTLSWRWKLAAIDAAGLDVIVDGNDLARTYEVSGDWSEDSFVFDDDGTHTVRFEFWNVGTSPSDCAYLDQVSWSGAGSGGGCTTTTPEPVPHTWLDGYGLVSGGDYEAAALATSANGVNKVWECYVAGLVPTNAAARFEARITIGPDGTPHISWDPDLNENGTKQERVYTVEGKAELTNSWGPTNTTSRFFHVKVGMPE